MLNKIRTDPIPIIHSTPKLKEKRSIFKTIRRKRSKLPMDSLKIDKKVTTKCN